MVHLLSKPEFQRRALPVSVAAWHAMIASGLAPQRAELIRGVILEKMSKSIHHAKLVSRLLRILTDALGTSFWVRQEAPLTLEDSEPEPDLSVVLGGEAEHDTHPSSALLVIEVSVTTMREDRELLSIYAEASVAEAWIVNAADHCIEVYRSPQAGTYATMEQSLAQGISSLALPCLRSK